MIGLIIAVIIILVIVIYVLKSIFEETDYQTWLNIALVTVILLTIILSIYMILNRANGDSKKQNIPPAKQEQQIEEQDNYKEEIEEAKNNNEQQQPQKQTSTKEMTDEELSISIAESFLTLKQNYEALNDGKDGSVYAANKIIEDYDLTKAEWDDFYKKAVQNGYLKQAEQNLKDKAAAAKK